MKVCVRVREVEESVCVCVCEFEREKMGLTVSLVGFKFISL